MPTCRTPRTKPDAIDFDKVITTFGPEVAKKLRTGDDSAEDHLRDSFRAHGVQDLRMLLPARHHDRRNAAVRPFGPFGPRSRRQRRTHRVRRIEKAQPRHTGELDLCQQHDLRQ